jgi:hypothetical protein
MWMPKERYREKIIFTIRHITIKWLWVDILNSFFEVIFF